LRWTVGLPGTVYWGNSETIRRLLGMKCEEPAKPGGERRARDLLVVIADGLADSIDSRRAASQHGALHGSDHLR